MAAVFGVHHRDLRLLDAKAPPGAKPAAPRFESLAQGTASAQAAGGVKQHPYSLSGRPQAVLVNMESIRCVIKRNAVFVLQQPAPQVAQLIADLQQHLHATSLARTSTAPAPCNYGGITLPFELKVLEAVLEAVAFHFDTLTSDLRATAQPALEDLLFSPSGQSPARVRRIKNMMMQLIARTENVRSVLQKLLADDAELYLLDLGAAGRLSPSTVRRLSRRASADRKLTSKLRRRQSLTRLSKRLSDAADTFLSCITSSDAAQNNALASGPSVSPQPFAPDAAAAKAAAGSAQRPSFLSSALPSLHNTTVVSGLGRGGTSDPPVPASAFSQPAVTPAATGASARRSLTSARSSASGGGGGDSSGSSSSSSSATSSFTMSARELAVARVEMLLEAYQFRIDHTWQQLQTLHDDIQDVEAKVNTQLDHHRNQIMALDIFLQSFMAVLTLMTCVAGFFGVNLNYRFMDEVPLFAVVTVSLAGGGLVLYVVFVVLMSQFDVVHFRHS